MRPNTLTHTKNTRQKTHSFLLDARNHYPTLKHHTPPPSEATPHPPGRAVSKPNSVSDDPSPTPHPRGPTRLLRTRHRPTTDRHPSRHGDPPPEPPHFVVLLRKEVIQPHLPVRLPCYDFTPIANPTFDGSLPEGWATGFGCCQLSWCDGRCVQGPGTYSPQQC